jgi:hypothetical protein
MSIPLEAVIGELHIIGGVRQNVTRPTAVLVAPRRAARGRPGDTLFVLVELRGQEPLPYEVLIDRIGEAYWKTPGTITSALRVAIAAANDWLWERNMPAPVADRLRAGISCAVLRGAEVLIAQAGPAAAYMAHYGQVERFPARDIVPPALGVSRGVEVRFSRAALSPGDALLLCDAGAAERLSEESAAQVLVYTGVEAALQSLEKLTGAADLIALVIESTAEAKAKAALEASVKRAAGVEPARPTPAPTLPQPEPEPAVSPEQAEPIEPAGRIVPVEPTEPIEEIEFAEQVTPEPMEPVSPIEAAGPREQAPIEPEPIKPTRPTRLVVTLPKRPPRSEPAEEIEELPVEKEPLERIPWIQRVGESVAQLHLGERIRAIGGSLAAGLMITARGIGTILQRTLPEGTLTPQPRGKGATMVLAGFAIFIPVMVAVLVTSTYMQYSTMARFQALLASAQNDATQAAALKDKTAQRTRWASAYAQAVAALQVRPGAPEARQIRDDAQHALDQIDNVVRLKTSLLWDFKTPGPRRLAVQGVNLFVLDRTANRVFQLTLNEAGDGVTDRGEPPTRAYKTQNVSDRQVGDLIDLVWMPAGGARTRSSLLVLDSGGLLEYDLAWNVTSVPLGQGPVPLGARAVAAFGGNLYVLDPTTSHLWRYRPQGSGYAAAESYFDPSPGDLTTAIDVGIDGSVYVLLADGRIRKFFGGQERPFAASGIADPIKRPVALSVDTEARESAVYVADAGGTRIVQLNTDGAFVRQLRAIGDAFDALEDVLVDERGGRLFVMSGGKLYSARLPIGP